MSGALVVLYRVVSATGSEKRCRVQLLPQSVPMRPIPILLTVGAATVAWRRARSRRQSAERLAAATLEALLNAIDANDEVTGQHVRRTAAYALILADALGVDETRRGMVERVALFHDIGKIHEALFDIVHDDDALSPEERAAIATHPQRGADVLAPLAAFYPELPEGVLAHHERWDGEGYPRRLRGKAIPLPARIVAIADTFDALTHSRRYRGGRSVETAVAVLTDGSGTQWDPELVTLFLYPAVFTRVRRVLDTSREPRRPKRVGRRTRGREETVPDVRFRWQSSTTAHP